MSPDSADRRDWERLKLDLAHVKKPVETAATLPPLCYTDNHFFTHEQTTVFRQSWLGIGRADRWQKLGDYAAIDVAGVPVVVLRGRDGELKAYANTCRHRGAKLLDGAGNCDTIRCPFHRWTYALDGRLLTAPHMGETADFDANAYGLMPLRAAARDGFAFICFDHATPPLDAWLGDFSKLHAPWALGDMVSTRRREFDVACNWKLFMEVFNEYYHLPYVHPDSIGGIYDLPDEAEEVSGQYATQFGTTQGTGGLLADDQDHTLPVIKSLSGRNAQGTRYTWLFPNMTFAAGTEAAWALDTYPLTADCTRVGVTACFPAETAARPDFEQRARHYYARLDAAIEEDKPALENQQAGLNSPFARQGRFCWLEPSVANFACWYAERIAATL